MGQVDSQLNTKTINKTLFTARVIDGFWDRFLVHGVNSDDLAQLRPTFTNVENWVSGWGKLAHEKVINAKELQKKGWVKEAEMLFRTAGLYFQLAQWLITERSDEKAKWLEMSINVFRVADKLSVAQTWYDTFKVDGHLCYGRVRVPNQPKGVIVIINPFDSTKEELFTYEMDYLDQGFITISFDGPGQGETYVREGFKATSHRWKWFVDRLIDYAHTIFPQYNLYLFGTSSGAAWALYGSTSPLVAKTVSISPAFMNKGAALPDYFLERVDNLAESGKDILPDFSHLKFRTPVLLAHGKKDVMVKSSDIYDLYKQLPAKSKLLEYEEEGHCCNYKLREIREISVGWFQEGEENSMKIDEFRQLISEMTNIPLDQILPESSFKDDLAIDSLQLVNLVIEVSSQMHADLTNIQSLKDIETVEGFYNLLERGDGDGNAC